MESVDIPLIDKTSTKLLATPNMQNCVLTPKKMSWNQWKFHRFDKTSTKLLATQNMQNWVSTPKNCKKRKKKITKENNL